MSSVDEETKKTRYAARVNRARASNLKLTEHPKNNNDNLVESPEFVSIEINDVTVNETNENHDIRNAENIFEKGLCSCAAFFGFQILYRKY